ncbi:Uncharacterised protein [Raoultella terrigena]|uniref:Uncharacterized protein n=1 Tax=Raoultella terrigena TaxID=577 RepID=A0A4U9D6D7_RAOTE|nr:Uncharacterised protein [Raoultella terrigena]
MIDKVLHPVDITRKSANAVVNGDDIGFQLVDEVVQRLQRRNDAAG